MTLAFSCLLCLVIYFFLNSLDHMAHSCSSGKQPSHTPPYTHRWYAKLSKALMAQSAHLCALRRVTGGKDYFEAFLANKSLIRERG